MLEWAATWLGFVLWLVVELLQLRSHLGYLFLFGFFPLVKGAQIQEDQQEFLIAKYLHTKQTNLVFISCQIDSSSSVHCLANLSPTILSKTDATTQHVSTPPSGGHRAGNVDKSTSAQQRLIGRGQSNRCSRSRGHRSRSHSR